MSTLLYHAPRVTFTVPRMNSAWAARWETVFVMRRIPSPAEIVTVCAQLGGTQPAWAPVAQAWLRTWGSDRGRTTWLVVALCNMMQLPGILQPPLWVPL